MDLVCFLMPTNFLAGVSFLVHGASFLVCVLNCVLSLYAALASLIAVLIAAVNRQDLQEGHPRLYIGV